VVSYVNTTAEVKAASDICCTSSNAVQIVDAMESDTVIMTPDQFLAQNVANQSKKKVVFWPGSCIVHELYTAEDLRAYREHDPEVKIIAHPECTPEVVAEADFTGSTSGIIDWVHQHKPAKAMLVTECSMASNISDELPEVEFAKPCNMCPYMKKITLEKVLWSLHTMQEQVVVDAVVAQKARLAVERMIDLSRKLGL
jgi:quinolinate synthase